MCNQHKLKSPVREIEDLFANLRTPVPLRYPEGVPNLEPRNCIRITDTGPIVRSGPGGLELVQRPWSWKGPTGAPVFNFRSEGRRFPPAVRCAIPTDGFYEFTAPEPGSKRKTRWLFTMAGQGPFFIAGLIRDQAWAMLTTAPGADIAPYHDRQVVVLNPEHAAAWLSGAPEAGLLRPSPEGCLRAERVV